jgi:hypothetical protein
MIYAIFSIVIRIIYGLAVPAVVTAAVPTTEEMAMTSDVETYSMARPCIHDVAVVEPDIVLVSMLSEFESGPT